MFDNIVAKEGHKKILIAFIAFLFFVIVECGLLAFLSFATFAFLIYLYRYKYIDINTLKEDEIYAPISGKVVAIDSKDFKKSIYIDVNMCNSHILRSLESGKANITLSRGLNLSLDSFKSKKLNEKAKIEYKNSSIELLSSTCNSSIKLEKKANFRKGEKIGTFLHGQVVITFDSQFEILIKIGNKVESGTTILAIRK